MTTVNAEKAFELMYELFKAKPWLNSAGVMAGDDFHAESEAVAFLLTLDQAEGWGDCSAPARRVVNSLLLDFLSKLRGSMAHHTWEVDAGLPKWRQAVAVISSEILGSHPHLSKRH
ncbi:hypothetical protein [Thiothrix nivea]|uniref:Uncharacterized protein n=1 Tax=Thiothrix nivea (strain ATCC 35100 / DSM 5205 / JP2) TaxID=870187 RepID=A0A656HCZ3_THINJ|nr:hypothetical protein [Thiothrix nivea]EIJ33330.1 hypothetical protein Thini_0693 [Thiothrix nivea DSM 5205]